MEGGSRSESYGGTFGKNGIKSEVAYTRSSVALQEGDAIVSYCDDWVASGVAEVQERSKKCWSWQVWQVG